MVRTFFVRLVARRIGIVAALVAVVVRGRRASRGSPDRRPCCRRAPGTVAIGTATVAIGATTVGNGTATIADGTATIATGADAGCPIPASTNAARPIPASTDAADPGTSSHVCDVTSTRYRGSLIHDST